MKHHAVTERSNQHVGINNDMVLLHIGIIYDTIRLVKGKALAVE